MESAYVALQLSENELEKLVDSSSKTGPNGLQNVVQAARETHYDVVCVPLTNSKWRERWQQMCLSGDDGTMRDVLSDQQAEVWRSGATTFRLDEVVVKTLEDSPHVIALASDWIYLDSSDDWIRHDSELALLQEVAWAAYLNMGTLVLPAPRHRNNLSSYARAVSSALAHLGVSHLQLSIRLPVYDPSVLASTSVASSSGAITSTSMSVEGHMNLAWELWDTIRSICDYSNRLSLTLDMNLVPPIVNLSASLERWFAEPVRNVMFPASCFVSNPKGYPVLSKPLQQFVRSIVKFQPLFIVSQTNAGLHSSGGQLAYVQYLRHLEKTSPAIIAQTTQGTLQNFTLGWGDYLQAPLQPLQDNLGSATYDVFEACPTKYKLYEEAIVLALSDKADVELPSIYIVGAGRGPLVECTLRALDKFGRKGNIWAVEKNPNAYVTLQDLKQNSWGTRVNLIFGDMRNVPTPGLNERADILVSELLGSFGDNELSPECLDGAIRLLKPEGVSIPSSYTAFLCPISSSKLYNEVRSRDQSLKDAETPYVVALHAFNMLSGNGGGLQNGCGSNIQECWSFEHPTKDIVTDAQGAPMTNSHNIRSASLKFHIPKASILHGLAGYFEAVLYGDVGLSIHPERMDNISPNMTSWFPLLFPVKDPLYLPSNSELHVSIWRLTDKRRVWYEWYAESFLPSPGPTNSNRISPVLPASTSFQLSTPVRAASPLVDAASPATYPISFPISSHTPKPSVESVGIGNNACTLVKIGQTALHNPNGRSSWIGL